MNDNISINKRIPMVTYIIKGTRGGGWSLEVDEDDLIRLFAAIQGILLEEA